MKMILVFVLSSFWKIEVYIIWHIKNNIELSYENFILVIFYYLFVGQQNRKKLLL